MLWSSTFVKHVFRFFNSNREFLSWEYNFKHNKITNNLQHFLLYYRVVQEEAQRSQDRKSPCRTNGCNENRSIDILEMLSKAKVEYDRVRKGGMCSYFFFSFFFNCTRNCVQLIPSVAKSGSYCIFWYVV